MSFLDNFSSSVSNVSRFSAGLVENLRAPNNDSYDGGWLEIISSDVDWRDVDGMLVTAWGDVDGWFTWRFRYVLYSFWSWTCFVQLLSHLHLAEVYLFRNHKFFWWLICWVNSAWKTLLYISMVIQFSWFTNIDAAVSSLLFNTVMCAPCIAKNFASSVFWCMEQ